MSTNGRLSWIRTLGRFHCECVRGYRVCVLRAHWQKYQIFLLGTWRLFLAEGSSGPESKLLPAVTWTKNEESESPWNLIVYRCRKASCFAQSRIEQSLTWCHQTTCIRWFLRLKFFGELPPKPLNEHRMRSRGVGQISKAHRNHYNERSQIVKWYWLLADRLSAQHSLPSKTM